MKNTLLAVLIFFAGFFVSRFYFSRSADMAPSTSHSLDESGQAVSTKSEPEAAPNSKTEVVARQAPPAKSDSSTASSPISDEKKRVLEDLTEDDIETWRNLRHEKTKDFLRNDPEYWTVGFEAEKKGLPGQLDLNVLQSSLGKYECKIVYEIRETKVKSTYQFSLDLNGAESTAKNHLRMVGGSSEQRGSMASDFAWQHLGSEGRDLNVVWYNSNGNESRYVSNFAFRLRSGMKTGERETVRLMGLGPTFNWVEIGTVEINKVR